MNILNSKEAFEAMMAGRNIMCRAVGKLMDFEDLDCFPATVFAMPGHEFCIKVETMELAGITFTKPLELDDVVEGQEVFLVYPNHIAHTQFTSLSGKYVDCVKNGFAQMDQENAELQLQAIGKLLGRTIAYPLTIESHYKPEKKRRSRKAKEDTDQTSEPAGPGDTIPNIEKQPEAEPVQAVEKWIDPEELKKQYLLRLHKLTTTEEVMQLRYEINPDNRLSKTQITYLNVAAEQKIAKIEKDAAEQTTTPAELEPENIKNSTSNDVEEKTLSVDELKRLQKEAEALVQEKKQNADATEQPIHIFSATKRDQMIEHILNLNTTEALEKYAPAITAAKPSMHPEHHIAVLNAYSKRKVTLDQLDLLSTDGVQEA
ncbi:hypothetical protein [Acinetobacter radioresistens]|uniref:hypothetical protein n=1 Tax=Acinetobacter radioresistens TaxID=40216 RepID=UPI002004CC4E|nr:hypothetical protein [Acinetobacter radioresistens]MCK4079840.1 hypothetical protein [Acinetobacter radioresistens]